MPKTINKPRYRAWDEIDDEAPVNMEFINDAFIQPNAQEICDLFWTFGLTQDEGLILAYLLNPLRVGRGTVLEECLNRHRHLLPLWQVRYMWRSIGASISDSVYAALY
jgi:hypothetical protein